MQRRVMLAALLVALVPGRLPGQATAPGASAGDSPALPDWQPSKSVPGVHYMPLVGDAARPGAYVYRIRVPHGFLVPPHWHTRTMHLTVLSGTLVLAMGTSPDSAAAQRYAPGSFLVLPAEMRHVEWFDGETVVHVETEGPFETVFVNPSDDPRNRGRP